MQDEKETQQRGWQKEAAAAAVDIPEHQWQQRGWQKKAAAAAAADSPEHHRHHWPLDPGFTTKMGEVDLQNPLTKNWRIHLGRGERRRLDQTKGRRT